MAVTVQLPGYNHAAPGVGLAQVLGEGVSAYRNYKQSQLADTENETKQIQNKQASLANEKAQEAYQQASDPNSTFSTTARASALSQLGAISQAKVAQNPQTRAGLNQLADIIGNGAPVNDGAFGPQNRRPLNAIEVNNMFSENPFVKNMNDQMKAEQQGMNAVAAAGVRAAPQYARLEETKNQNAAAAGKAFEADPVLKQSVVSLNSLKRSQSILDNPNKPVTSKDLNLAYNDYINAVAAGGAATEGKIARELPNTWEQTWNEVKQRAGENDDLRKTPGGAALIGLLKENIRTVNGDLGSAIKDRATNLSQNYLQNSNSKVQSTVQQKVKDYSSMGGGEPAGKPAPGGHATVQQNGHTYNWNAQTGKYE